MMAKEVIYGSPVTGGIGVRRFYGSLRTTAVVERSKASADVAFGLARDRRRLRTCVFSSSKEHNVIYDAR